VPTIADLIDDVRTELNGELGATWNVVDGAVLVAGTSIVFADDLGSMGPGTILVTSTGEELFVRSVNTGTQTATVVRGWNRSTPAAIADGAYIEVDPRFSPRRVRRAVHAELRSLPTSLFRVEHAQATVDNGGRLALLSTEDILRVLEVRRDADSSIETRDNHPLLPSIDWQLQRTGPSGYQGTHIGLARDAVPGRVGTTLYAAVAVGFSVEDLDDSTDLLDDVGLSVHMLDIPLWGACAQTITFAEAARLDTQAVNQRANQENVPATAMTQVGREYARIRDHRIRVEADRLRAIWGV
jgi:hypothetical protein